MDTTGLAPAPSRAPARRRTRAAVAALLTAWLGAACAAPTDGRDEQDDAAPSARAGSVPDGAPGITGTVTHVQPGDSVPRRGPTGDPSGSVSCPPSCAPGGPPLRAVRIEEVPGDLTTGGDKSVVTVLQGARVLRRGPGGVTEVGFGAIRVGQRISAWFDGPIAESYPSQGRARLLLIEE